jgi:hypothetical protein
MVFSGMLRREALVRTYVSEEPGASFIRVTRIGEVSTTQAATSNRRTCEEIALGSSETSVLTRATRHNNPEDTILHSHRRENLKSFNLHRSLKCLSPEHGNDKEDLLPGNTDNACARKQN